MTPSSERPPDWLGKLRGERLEFVAGGAQRVDSVRAGLDALTDDATIILIHDAELGASTRLARQTARRAAGVCGGWRAACGFRPRRTRRADGRRDDHSHP